MMTITVDNDNVIMDIDEIDNTESTIVKRLNLSNFGLKSLGDEVHKHLPFLEELNASNNELENINLCSELLTKLDCRNNKLNDVDFVQHLPNLEELCLSGNSLGLADHYIAATLCPKLKFIDGKSIAFNVPDINREFDRRLWPQIVHVWKSKFEKRFSTKLKDVKLNKLIERFVKLVKSKKLYTQQGVEKFTDFKVKRLVDDLLNEEKSKFDQLLPSKTYEKRLSEKPSEETEMPPATRSRSASKSRTRNSSGIPQRGKPHSENVPAHNDSKKNKEKHKSSKDHARHAHHSTERKLRHSRKVVELWPHSSHRRKLLEDAEPNLGHHTIVHTSEAIFPNPKDGHRKKCAAPRAKKSKLESDSDSSRDDVAGSSVRSESDISLTTATERALNFISSTPRRAKEKCEASFPSRSTSPRNKNRGQKYLLRKDDESERKSRIPAPITRSSTRSRTMTSLHTSPTSRMRLRNSSLLLTPNKNKEYAGAGKKDAKVDRSDSCRTTQRSMRSSRTLRNELAIYNDIENWCEDIDEHFLPDQEAPRPVATTKTESRSVPKSTRTLLSALDPHERAVKTVTRTRVVTKTIPVSSKSSLEKPYARKAKKGKRHKRRLAPLIVSGDEESLELDPSVHAPPVKCKLESETDSSENLDRISSNNSWKKENSDSDFTVSPIDDLETDTDEELETGFSKYETRRSPTRWSARLEAREKEKDWAEARRCLRGSSKVTDDLQQLHERREVREMDSERREVRERQTHNSCRANVNFDEPEICLRNKTKIKSSVTSRWGTPSRGNESRVSMRKYGSSESPSPRTKLADKKSRLSVEERTFSLPSLMERDWNPLHFLKCHSGDSSNNTLDDDKTQVWHCAFEPDSCDNRSHLVATCGGQTVCLIDCESGRVVNRYKHARSSEEFFTLAWTTLKVDKGRDRKANILAVGGKRGMILLLQPNHLVCYAELSGHKDMISGLNFHPEVPQILCSGSTDGTIIVWDIGIPTGKTYETEWRHIHIIKVQYDVLNVLFVPQVDFLLAGTENSCWGWGFDPRQPNLMTKMPSVEFVHPTKVSGTVQMESVVDAMVLVSKNVVASKCAGYKCIYLWDISATILSTIKKLTRGVRLNIQVLAILQWSDNDNFYLNMGCSKESKILACGDASGKLWIYQLQELLANRRENLKSQQQVVSPVILIDWPECRLRSSNKNPEREINLNNVVINSVSVSSDACYITAVTDKNIVCIWN